MNSAEFLRGLPDERAAIARFERVRWPSQRNCPFCGSTNTAVVKSKRPQPYRCREKGCRKSFSAKVGTVLQRSKLSVRDWLYATYLLSISKNGLSSLLLGRELGISQEAAWRLGRKIREAWNQGALFPESVAPSPGVHTPTFRGRQGSKHVRARRHPQPHLDADSA